MPRILQSFFLGKWLGHPLHPALVHIPIALLPGSWIFDVLSLLGFGNAFVQISFWCLFAGLMVALLLVVPAGLAEWSQIKREKNAWHLTLYHMIANSISMALYMASLILRIETLHEASLVPVIPFALSSVATATMFLGVYVGGRIVYDNGIGVARTSKKQLQKQAQDGHANLAQEKS